MDKKKQNKPIIIGICDIVGRSPARLAAHISEPSCVMADNIAFIDTFKEEADIDDALLCKMKDMVTIVVADSTRVNDFKDFASNLNKKAHTKLIKILEQEVLNKQTSAPISIKDLRLDFNSVNYREDVTPTKSRYSKRIHGKSKYF